MGCNCKSKKRVSEAPSTTNNSVGEFFKSLGAFLGLLIIVTMLLPVVWVVLIIMVYKNVYNDGFDLVKFTKKLMGKNKHEAEDNADINTDDIELVGVDEITK